MFHPRALVALLALACGVAALGVAALGVARAPRWFLDVGPVTRVVTRRVLVTQMTPSSCVEVATSLPPCRHLRQMTITPTSPTSIEITRDLEGGRGFWDGGWLSPSKQQADDALLQATPQGADAAAATPGFESPSPDAGWRINQLFDRLYSTVTSTVVERATARVDDVDHVITFSVVGCLPSELPFSLARCRPGENVGGGVGDNVVEKKGDVGVAVGPDPRSAV